MKTPYCRGLFRAIEIVMCCCPARNHLTWTASASEHQLVLMRLLKAWSQPATRRAVQYHAQALRNPHALSDLTWRKVFAKAVNNGSGL